MLKKYLIINIICSLLILGCSETKNKKEVVDSNLFYTQKKQIKEFYYAVRNQEKIEIYKYNFAKKNSERFWSDIKEKVIILSYSPDLKNIYFLTSKFFGTRSTLTYIKRIKLYKINLKTEDVTFVDSLINGTQINADWVSNNAFEVIINVRDLQVSEYMNKNTFIYNNSGKRLLVKKETINFIKDGYPLPVIREAIDKSFKDFELKINGLKKDSLYLFNNKTSEYNFITYLNENKIDEIFLNDEYLIITIMSKRKNLIIYSLNKKQIVKKIDDIKNFIVFGKYLVYDYDSGLSSSISIFNLEKSEITDTIKTKDGCGLRNVFN